MPRTSSLPLVDRILEGRLEHELAERRSRGDSYAVISRWLTIEHDLDITGETIRAWCLSLGIEKPEREAGNATALAALLGLLLVAVLLGWAFVTLAAGLERVGSVTDDRLGTTSGLVCEANGCLP